MSQIENYIKNKSIEIRAKIGDRKIVYLDTKFWIALSDRKNDDEKNFFYKVNELFETNKCIFPASELVVAEIAKQADLGGRYRCIQNIDRFSGGFAIVNQAERRKIEFKHWLQKKIGIEKHQLSELIWSTVSFSKLGFLDNLVREDIEQASLLEIEMGNSKVFTFQPNPDILNDEIQKHAHEHTTLRDLTLAEIWGILQEYKSVFAETVIDDPQIEQKLALYLNEISKSKEDHYCEAVFSHFYANHMFNELPVFHIFPLLFAHLRHSNIKYKGGNDTIDFLHASFGLPFCNYFFTDRKLYLRINELKLGELYNCVVEYDLKKITDLLNSI